MKTNILLVGCGNMGFAMLEGWMKQSTDRVFHVVEPVTALAERAARAGALVYPTAAGLPSGFAPALTFLAVKPQVMAQAVPAYKGLETCFVSIAAGVTLAGLAAWLGPDAALIRCMPNTPAAIGQGMMVTTANAKVSAGQKDLADRLLSANGQTATVDDESLMDAVTAISGSGPAYLFHFIECLSAAAVGLGLPDGISRQLALQTVQGAANLAAERRAQDGTEPAVLRQQVTSPGGTTAAALRVFMEQDALKTLVEKATTAARDRGIALGKS